MKTHSRSRRMSFSLRRLLFLMGLLCVVWLLYMIFFALSLSHTLADSSSNQAQKEANEEYFHAMFGSWREEKRKVKNEESREERGGDFALQNEENNVWKEWSRSKQREERSKAENDQIRRQYQDEVERLQQESGVTLPDFIPWNPPDAPGEGGFAYNIAHRDMTEEEVKLYEEGMRTYAYNSWLSDKISVRRRLASPIVSACKLTQAAADLSPVSVIVCFYNDAWSVLLRTVHSILDRTPPHLLQELILVDDFSSLEHLKRPLEVYLGTLPKVRLVRALKREGLIRARLLGYRLASAPTLVFLDSHIECFPGWLEPLLARIREDRRAVVFPVIEVIHAETLEVLPKLKLNSYGVFRWQDLTFQWGSIPQRVLSQLHSLADPIRSPTMPGGLFAIDKAWFTTLGTYDSQLDFWGAENIELSFKVWMCNGTVEIIPCSHVGHIFRFRNPATWTGGDPGLRNSLRVAEVWTDDYKNLLYERFNFKVPSFGDVSERRILRMRLGCRSFHWYRQHVYPEMECPDARYSGQVRNKRYGVCLDSMGKLETPGVFPCHSLGGSQYWLLSKEGRLQHGDLLLCALDSTLSLQRKHCLAGSTGQWLLSKKRQLQLNGTNNCLQVDQVSKTFSLTLQPCTAKLDQTWMLQRRQWKLPEL